MRLVKFEKVFDHVTAIDGKKSNLRIDFQFRLIPEEMAWIHLSYIFDNCRSYKSTKKCI